MGGATIPVIVNRADPARIDALLPQTQCTCCGFDGCRPYAEAIAGGVAKINRCSPGGDAVIAGLAQLTGHAQRPLDPACGAHRPRLLAVIDEAHCIGCTLCIKACPVDAIIGMTKHMHAVVPSLCSGCELCVAPCPVDCIAIVESGTPWTANDANASRARHDARKTRLAAGERISTRVCSPAPPSDDPRRREALVAAALARARARRAVQPGQP